ncbi:hypothetical protein P4B35_17565 [Pontiellaceae bacterium B12227]|nr:hypothetical protein [Pontiellaceae bacterium B12227]
MKKQMMTLALALLAATVHANDLTIGFEAAEGYTAGQFPPAPWTYYGGNNSTTDQVRVSNAQAHSGINSLAVSENFYDHARYPLAVEPGESASFSVWVRPSFTANNAQAAYIGVVPGNTSRVRSLQFERSFFSNAGSTAYSVHWYEFGARKSVQGDYTSSTWYLVNGEITPTEIILSTTTASGPLTYSFDRMGEAITAIELGSAGGYEYEARVAYYDDLTIIPPRDDVPLTVASALGSPTPAVGTTTNSWGTVINCSVDHVNAGTTQYECIGWTGTGSVPSSGTSNAVEVSLTEASSIVWNWQTNYWLDINVTGNGSVNVTDGFYTKGSNQILTVTPAAGWLFMGWSGDASGTNDATVIMDAPKTVMATFSDDADGDGLTNNEEAAAGSNPWKSDTDGDGFNDKLEVDHNWNPTVSDQWAVDHIANNGSTFGLYPSNVVLDVAVGQMIIETDGINATLSLQLEESEDLITWSNAGPAEVWSWPVDSEKKFFRVRSIK